MKSEQWKEEAQSPGNKWSATSGILYGNITVLQLENGLLLDVVYQHVLSYSFYKFHNKEGQGAQKRNKDCDVLGQDGSNQETKTSNAFDQETNKGNTLDQETMIGRRYQPKNILKQILHKYFMPVFRFKWVMKKKLPIKLK